MRSLYRFALFALLVFGSGRARAQDDASAPRPPPPDSGEPSDGGEVQPDGGAGCGNVTEQGFCDSTGMVLTYCNTTTNMVEVINCAEDTASSRCIEINPTYGSDCAEAPGSTCLAEDENGEFFPLFCYGTTPGCLETEDAQVCTENLGTCTMDQVGSCMGDRLYAECSEGQPYLIDCASYGGECSAAACRGVDLGKFCDNLTFFCESEDRCVLRSCIPNVAPDSGVPAPDAGADPSDEDAGVDDGGTNGDPEDESCACTGTQGVSASSLFFALAVLLRRRRSKSSSA